MEFLSRTLRLHREIPALARLDKKSTDVVAYPNQKTLFLRRWNGASRVFAVFNFDTRPVELSLPIPAGQWQELLESAEKRWQGSGSEVPESIDSRGKA